MDPELLIALLALLMALKCFLEQGQTRAEIKRMKERLQADPATEAWYTDLVRRAE